MKNYVSIIVVTVHLVTVFNHLQFSCAISPPEALNFEILEYSFNLKYSNHVNNKLKKIMYIMRLHSSDQLAYTYTSF